MAIELHVAPDRTKYAITKYVDGKVADADRFDPKAKGPRERVAKAFGLSDADLLDLVERVRVSGAPVRVPVAGPAAEDRGGTFIVRGIDQRAEDGERVKADADRFLREVLPGVPVDKVVQWKGEEDVVCLDVDYHDRPSPPRDWLESVVFTRINPRPAAWHFSKGGGLHLFYKAIPPFAADDLAGAAALKLRVIDAAAGLEFKTVVRGPGGERVHYADAEDTGGTEMAAWVESTSGEADQDARDAWLEAEGMAIGSRYDHAKCPIDGGTPSTHPDPVSVGDHGIYCFKCQSAGLSLGCRVPGYAPWPAILGAPSSGQLGRMVRNLTHWGHARHVLGSRYNIPDGIAERVYRAALRAYHHGRPSFDLVEGVFDSDRRRFARVGKQWGNPEQNYIYPKDIQQILATLPVCQYVSEDGRVKVRAARLQDMGTNQDWSEYGYAPLELVHGFAMTRQWLGTAPGLDTQVTVPNPLLVVDESRRLLPRYVPKKQRMGREEAWKVLEDTFPRIDRTLVQLALCAFACAQETRAGLLPVTFVEGPSGAAKTATLRVAAGIYGSQAQDVIYDRDDTKLRQSMYEAAQRGPGILLNELIKDVIRQNAGRASPKDALDWLLNMTPSAMYRGLYRDSHPFGRIPSLWITEPACPAEVRDEMQLARRIRHYRVSGNKEDWALKIAKARLPQSDLNLIRRSGEKVNEACNAVLSYACDDFFSTPMTWDEMADALGVFTIEKSPNFVDTNPDLRYLFKLVCKAPALEGRAAARYPGGFKRIVPNANEDEDELSAFYRYWADGTGGQFFTSRKLTEKDWGKILGASDKDIRWDARTDGANLYVRFTHGPVTRPLGVNDQLVDLKTLFPEV